MDFQHQDIEREYIRWRDEIGLEDPYASQETLGIHEVLKAHFLIVDYFADKNYGIGGVGPRSLDLLHSTLSRQFTGFAGIQKWNGLYPNCATLMYGLIKNHPFYDVNKRTALLSALFLLQRNKKLVTLPQRKLDGLMLAIAEDQLSVYFARDARYQRELASMTNHRDPDKVVGLLADFLRRNTRHLDNAARTVTYVELNRVLSARGFRLENPSGNYIDVVRIDPPKKGIFGVGSAPERHVHLAQVGFPGWKEQVHKAALKTIRLATGMTTQNGFDNQVLFNGAEPLNSLISEYAEPLKRLADR